jgi:sugar lactone lactonase YvrE
MPAPRAQVAALLLALASAPRCAVAQASRDSLAGGTLLRELADSTLWPEGVDRDPRTGDFYVASVRHRTIVRVSKYGREYELWPGDDVRFGAMLGVRVDPRRPFVWATTSGIPQMEDWVPADSAIAALLQIEARTGRILRRWDLPVAPHGHVLGDLAIGPRGDVYLTDSYHPVLYRLRPGADTLERITDSLFRSLQGMAPTDDDRFLYVADYSHGLLRVHLTDGAVRRLGVAAGVDTRGCDGIVLHRGAIVAVQNGATPARIVRFVLDAAGDSIVAAQTIDRNPVLAPEPTIGTMMDDRFVYVANSQWEEFDDAGHLKPGARLTRPRLVAVPVPRGMPRQ